MGRNHRDWSDSIDEGNTLCSFQGSVYRSPEKSHRSVRIGNDHEFAFQQSSVEEDDTICSYQGSVYKSPEKTKRSSRRIRNHQSPEMSPIKGNHNASRSIRTSFDHLFTKHNNFENLTHSTVDHVYNDFQRQLNKLEKGFSTESEDNFAGHNLYNQAKEVQEFLLAKNTKRPPTSYSTYHEPEPTWVPTFTERESEVVEDPRHQSVSHHEIPRMNGKNDEIIEHLLDQSLKHMKVAKTSCIKREEKKKTCPLKPTNPPEIPRRSRLDLSKIAPTCEKQYSVKATNTTLPTKATNTSLPFPSVSSDRRQSPSPQARSEPTSMYSTAKRVSRPNVKEVVKSCFSHCDVDSIPRRGGVEAYQREMSSSNIYAALNAYYQPRKPITVRSKSSSASQRSLQKEPFCSASNGSAAQAIYGNEAELRRIVDTYYPHWRNFVHQLLSDPGVKNDVAVRFLEEIEKRRLSKIDFEFSDPQIAEFNSKDEKIAKRVTDLLGRGHSSRLWQLRILQQALKESFC